MFVLSLAAVLISLLSFSAAVPVTDDCSQRTQPLTVNEVHQILGKWILIEGFSNNEIFDDVLEHLESLWVIMNTTADNRTLLLDQANPLPTRPHHNGAHVNPPEQHQTPVVRPEGHEIGDTEAVAEKPVSTATSTGLWTGRCLRFANNVTLVDDKILEVHLAIAHTYHRFLQTCHNCLLMHLYTKENDYQALYLFGRNNTLPASDLESFRKQAECLHFPQVAKFHYDTSKELCPT